MKNISLMIFVSLLASCTANRKGDVVSAIGKNDSLYIINIDKINREKSIDYSSYFKDVKTIILETNENCFITDISVIRVVGDFIIIMDDKQDAEVLVFDKSGHFLHKIGKAGQGPGEYINMSDLSIDFDKKEIYLLDSYDYTIRQYDIETGKFMGSIHLDIDEYSVSYIYYVNNKMYVSVTPYPKDKDPFLLQEIDMKTGKCIGSHLKASEYNRGWSNNFQRSEGFFYPDGKGSAKYVEMFMDTIVSVGSDGIKPYLVLKDKRWFTAKNINELIEAQKESESMSFQRMLHGDDLSWNINRYFETENMICFQYKKGMDMPSVIYDKKTNTARITDMFQDDILFNIEGTFISIFTFADSKGVYAYIKTSLIPILLEGVELGMVNLDLDKLELLKDLPEDSNPVLLYYECK